MFGAIKGFDMSLLLDNGAVVTLPCKDAWPRVTDSYWFYIPEPQIVKLKHKLKLPLNHKTSCIVEEQTRKSNNS